MRVTLLGTGSSSGVPVIGCKCNVCLSNDPKNKRRRVSILVEKDNTKILVDTSPDLRLQALENKITVIDAVLFTHEHADHTHGIDELRWLSRNSNASIDAYSDKYTFDLLRKKFEYVFAASSYEGWFKPYLFTKEIEPYKPFKINNIEIMPFEQIHGKVTSLGYRFDNKIAYSTDTNSISDKSLDLLKGIDLWIVDCLKYTPSYSHADFNLVMKWFDIVKPKKAILTHMNHEIDYNKISQELPHFAKPGYDGMVVKIDE